MAESPYQTIKRSIATGIASGQYGIGQILPSEHALCRDFGVSRMTVNRAMRELVHENLVRRIPGVGTFVAEPVATGELLEIHNIADEIAGRGHIHRATVLTLAATTPPPHILAAFALPHGASLFHSVLIHHENDLPIQLEQRFVNPALAPEYLRQDFSRVTPNAYLTRVAPLQQVEHVVRAIAADASAAQHLRLKPGAPCLAVTRRTWSANALAALTELIHPGDRFALSGRFTPDRTQIHPEKPAP